MKNTVLTWKKAKKKKEKLIVKENNAIIQLKVDEATHHFLYLRKKMYPLRIHLFIISISHANQL